MPESRRNDLPMRVAKPSRVMDCERKLHEPSERQHLYGDVYWRCLICSRDDAAKEAAREEKYRRQEEEERDAQQLSINLRHCGVGPRFEHVGLGNFDTPTSEHVAVLTACRSFLECFEERAGGGLWIIGGLGNGKTHLGSAMVNYLIRERGIGACICGIQDITAMHRARWGVRATPGDRYADDSVRTSDDLIEFLGRVPLLVLDDVGVTSGTPEEHKLMFCIADERYQQMRPTVLLSNLPPAGIKPVIGDRVYDRLRDGVKLLVCDWPSSRGSQS